MSFDTLLVIVLAGIAGPLLALVGKRRFVPVVIGAVCTLGVASLLAPPKTRAVAGTAAPLRASP